MLPGNGQAVNEKPESDFTVDAFRGAKYLQCRYAELALKIRVKKWGNSLALRIPQSFDADVRLTEGMQVELSLVEGKLIIHPLAQPPITLDELLQGVSDENLHGEWDTGPSAGREIW